MKNIWISLPVAVVVGLFVTLASAMDVVSVNPDTVEKRELLSEITPDSCRIFGEIRYVGVGLTGLPQHVKSAVMIRYAAYSIGEVFRGDDHTFQMILKNENRKLAVCYDEQGMLVKEEAIKDIPTVCLLR